MSHFLAFLVADPQQPDDRGGNQEGELDGVPERDQHDEVDPAGRAVVEQGHGHGHDRGVDGDADQTDERSPFDAGAGVHAADDDVAGRVGLEQAVEAGAERPAGGEQHGVPVLQVGRLHVTWPGA
jgi:hypothetical protein